MTDRLRAIVGVGARHSVHKLMLGPDNQCARAIDHIHQFARAIENHADLALGLLTVEVRKLPAITGCYLRRKVLLNIWLELLFDLFLAQAGSVAEPVANKPFFSGLPPLTWHNPCKGICIGLGAFEQAVVAVRLRRAPAIICVTVVPIRRR